MMKSIVCVLLLAIYNPVQSFFIFPLDDFLTGAAKAVEDELKPISTMYFDDSSHLEELAVPVFDQMVAEMKKANDSVLSMIKDHQQEINGGFTDCTLSVQLDNYDSSSHVEVDVELRYIKICNSKYNENLAVNYSDDEDYQSKHYKSCGIFDIPSKCVSKTFAEVVVSDTGLVTVELKDQVSQPLMEVKNALQSLQDLANKKFDFTYPPDMQTKFDSYNNGTINSLQELLLQPVMIDEVVVDVLVVDEVVVDEVVVDEVVVDEVVVDEVVVDEVVVDEVVALEADVVETDEVDESEALVQFEPQPAETKKAPIVSKELFDSIDFEEMNLPSAVRLTKLNV